MNDFYFWPVGQGLFYTEYLQNGKFNFVYDCGTENKEDLIEIQINNFVNNVLCSE